LICWRQKREIHAAKVTDVDIDLDKMSIQQWMHEEITCWNGANFKLHGKEDCQIQSFYKTINKGLKPLFVAILHFSRLISFFNFALFIHLSNELPHCDADFCFMRKSLTPSSAIKKVQVFLHRLFLHSSRYTYL